MIATDETRPIRTFCTAVTYYHKFRLAHKDSEYQFQDAATAALLVGCKIEDTLKKSREILCAAYNLKMQSGSEHLSSDDPAFDTPSKNVIGLERLMLEASAFDYRCRCPEKHVVKLAKVTGIAYHVYRVAWWILVDSYKTWAPMKQTSITMAWACLELATLITGENQDNIRGEKVPTYTDFFKSGRAEVLETLLDLLELYTHFQKSTNIGPQYPIDHFINIRIGLNRELEDGSYQRYTNWDDEPISNGNGVKHNVKTPKTPITPASPAETRHNGASPATFSPKSSGSGRRGIGARGQEGTVRFMLDAEQAKREKEAVAEFFKTEYEEYEVEIEEPIRDDRNDRRGAPRDIRNGRDDRHSYRQKPRR